jgi:hypothetical protein
VSDVQKLLVDAGALKENDHRVLRKRQDDDDAEQNRRVDEASDDDWD